MGWRLHVPRAHLTHHLMNLHQLTATQPPSAHVLSPGYLQQLMLVCQWNDWHSSASLWLPVAYDTQQTAITTSPDTWTEDEWGAYINEYSELLNDLMTVEPRTEATVRLILESGCNLDDIAHLRWADIDIQHRRMTHLTH